ncbi:nucleotidyltransferase domain-containing protein [Pricia sp. S334]|uniref:Nucleotidyltransferase domain-containing protein n=1 Tax=Pricia mediterranea TaxID=3076079 RepID=A0ABU3L696_9FLAO|nr:nucleotidyltransferase domain-containing protein [Pricia sp. S334]MDT7829265.1 nucleotidyltransferase domain-containing protein [Pricia sp. S334]
MKFGLRREDIVEIKKALKQFPDIEEGIVFGSRAMGNQRRGSDVDIALKGSKITFDTVTKVAGILNEDTLMPYRFDVLGYDTLKNKALANHIDRVGQMLYRSGGGETKHVFPVSSHGSKE